MDQRFQQLGSDMVEVPESGNHFKHLLIRHQASLKLDGRRLEGAQTFLVTVLNCEFWTINTKFFSA
jgi:hypothetical protein